jgi:hypothetical protein
MRRSDWLPRMVALFVDRGKTLRSRSKFEQGISDFSHALEPGTKWTAACRERGLTYMLTGQPQPAIVDSATYDQLQPGDQEVVLALSELGNRQASPQPGNPSPESSSRMSSNR